MTDTSLILCNLPHGLVLQCRFPRGGGLGAAIELRGVNQGSPPLPEGYHGPEGMELRRGYGVTEVDTDVWTQWLEQNADQPFIRNQCIAAAVKA